MLKAHKVRMLKLMNREYFLLFYRGTGFQWLIVKVNFRERKIERVYPIPFKSAMIGVLHCSSIRLIKGRGQKDNWTKVNNKWLMITSVAVPVSAPITKGFLIYIIYYSVISCLHVSQNTHTHTTQTMNMLQWVYLLV